MEEKPLPKPAMVSRLPKFGARPSPGVNTPQPNGSPQPALPNHEGKTTPPPARPNGVIRASSFSPKWRKDGGSIPSGPTGPDAGACPEERGDKAQTQLPSLGKDVKKASPSTPKLRRSVSSVPCSPKATPSPKAIPSRTSPKAEAGFGWSPLGGGLSAVQNGSADTGRVASRSCLARPRATSSSPRSSSGDSLSQSSDSLKSLTPDSMVRSQSFPHVKRIPSPTNLPMTRSFSFNRAVELAKPLANTQLRTPGPSLIKPPQGLADGRAGQGLGAGGLRSPGALRYGRESPTSVLAPCTPSSALKKSLLPNCVLSKPSALVNRLARPGWTKQQRPLFTGRVKGEGGAGFGTGPVDRADSPPLTPDPPVGSERTPESGRLRDTPSQSQAGEGLEDMSLSSASSPEHNDTSEEFLDDLDNPGDGSEAVETPDNRKHGASAQTRLRSFLNETMDLAGMSQSGRKEEVGVRRFRGVLSSEEGDFLPGSSLEISPSNSSGGTYMWDEEGLEPLGGPVTHPCDSCDDSDLNSLDILNNLEHVDPGDLEEDDLMLDVDLPEDRSLHTDAEGMAHFDRSERGGRQGHWRRRQHRWNGPDHCHNDNKGPVFQQYDGLHDHPGSFRLGPRPLPPVGRADGQLGALDQLTLRHMAQDCSSVKNQLLKLKSLLQMEDGGVVPDIAEASEDNTAAMQLESLMKEVMVLRDELKMKNKTIAQLTTQQQQLQRQQQANAHPGRCSCHQRAPSTRADRRTRDDKSTQTPWRGHGPTGALPTPLLSPWQSHHQGAPGTSMPQRRQTSSTTASQPLPQREAPPGKTSKNSPHRGPQ